MKRFNFDIVIGTVVNHVITDHYNFPHRDFLDLSIIYRVPVLTNRGSALTVVTWDILKMMEKTEEDLYQIAVEYAEQHNIFIKMNTLLEILSDNTGIKIDTSCPFDAYVISNGDNLFGAFNITQVPVLDKCSKLLGGDLIILPSSIHELIVCKFDRDIAQAATLFVPEVNRTEVKPSDMLSNNVYIYRRDTKLVGLYFPNIVC